MLKRIKKTMGLPDAVKPVAAPKALSALKKREISAEALFLRGEAWRQKGKFKNALLQYDRGLIHYYGALAPRSPLRPVLVAKAEKQAERLARRKKVDKFKKKAKSWAACLARVFEVFPLICPKCNIEMKPVAVILNDKELVRLLNHLGLSAELPAYKPATKAQQICGPPDYDCQLDPRADLYEEIDPTPADD